ncbi:SpoIIE family protein phosphatase [Flammeovirga yaeyamensis]|uniref:SpoIIE family protein phosphatase n=1 Tax=Flammeovirga yaeyamensis TaxID=367791 RepID=A0AAX1MZ69_9BACT|nr:SpoIIE family protein phosphatase [Flammeovirga yaeyamensis]MBB3700869.1 serine phosphatase RsbU (regulator of sigma subunit)/HAMP domain-containing protein [Flammeovirga yaeyamensis]NMF37977.1 SpoIIE family protein phosphatase [Flammeovirga yaeyamensis]QWG00628.1 SpoIIE family protein phosphatase [Flammeovirga yaeyamensis]
MKLTPKKRQAKSIKTRLIWSFAANILIIFLLFSVYAYIRSVTNKAEQVALELDEITSNIQDLKSDKQSFLLTETINPSFYETKENDYLTTHEENLNKIQEKLEEMYTNSYVHSAKVIPELRELEKDLQSYSTIFDSLVSVQLKRGFKSYGTEGDMRRSIYSVMNSGYSLDQVKILMLRRHEKDYILRKDTQYEEKLSKVVDQLIGDISRMSIDKYGKIYLNGALEKYRENFRALVKLDEQLGFYGHPGIKDRLDTQLAAIEGKLKSIHHLIVDYNNFWKKLNIVVLIVFALSILSVNAILLFYLLSRLGKPINKLSKSIQKIVEDDFIGELYTIKTKDEIGDLSNDFNYMIERMNERTEEIEIQKEELAQTYDKIETIRQIGAKISKHLKVDKIVQEFYHSLNNTLEFNSFLIGIYQENKLHYRGYSVEGKPYAFDRSISENNHLGVQCYERQEPIVSNNFLSSPELKHFLPVTTSERVNSLVYLPLTSSSKKLGVLAVHSEHINAYSDVQINMLGSIVTYLINALDTAVNYQNMESQVEAKTAEIDKHRQQLLDNNEILQGTLLQLEEKNKQQTSSIQYAKRIQQALLPNISLIRSSFNDAFVFYRPKDIVSGDFYWFEQKGDLIYMAVADCTGHGVPGAFMSILGREILSNLVNSKKFTSPAELLDELHVRIRVVLKQDKMNNKDGMDIGICILDESSNVLKFAGAHHPLYLVRREGGANLIDVIDGNKQSIGGHIFKKKEYEKFKEHTIDLSRRGDILSFYMCTDGYQDQFGGPEGRKFYKKTFRELMSNIADKPMYVQKSLMAIKIDEWMGEHSQTDDILIIGFQPKKETKRITLDLSSIDEILNV